MYAKTKVLMLLIGLLISGCSGLGGAPTSTATLPPTVTLFPPSATPTPVILLTATTIPSYTPTSPASSAYYMIILDASARMREAFAGETKWEAAHASVQTLLDGLEPGANYGLVVIGASPTTEGALACLEPSVARTPFTNRTFVSQQLPDLQPIGGGSLTAAFTLAHQQFEGLPANTVKTLIVLTDTLDECQSEDEWKGLEKLYQAVGDAGLAFHSEIIVLGETVDPNIKAVADRVSRSSTLVNFRFPLDAASLEAVNASALTAIQDYVSKSLAGRSTETPEIAPITLTPDLGLPTNTLGASSYTLTPRPGTATFTPTITLTSIPRTATVTLTPTITRTPTATQPPTVELVSANYRTTGIGCQVEIIVNVSGSAATGSFHVMNSSNAPVGEVYPQVVLPVGMYGNNVVSLSGNQPSSYLHEVWFEMNGVQSNRLTGLICPLIPKTPTP